MPMYEYKCHGCGSVFEVRQKFSDEPLKIHETCGGEVERLISAPAFQFKGSGWYITDYARKSNGNSSPSRSNGEAKSESKPAATKTESKSSDSSSSTSKS